MADDLRKTDGGSPMQELRVETNQGGPGTAAAQIKTDLDERKATIAFSSSAEVPPGARAELVDAVLNRAEVQACDAIHAVVPLGDTESISRLGEHTHNSTGHAAGASAIIDADLGTSPPD